MIVCGFDVGLLWRVFGCAVGCADPSPAAETATSPASGRGGRGVTCRTGVGSKMSTMFGFGCS